MNGPPTVDYRATSARPTWAALPPALHEALAVALGTEITAAGPSVGSGFTGGFAAPVTLADGRRVFVKASDDTLHSYTAYQREAEVVPHLPPEAHAPTIITTAHTQAPSTTARTTTDGAPAPARNTTNAHASAHTHAPSTTAPPAHAGNAAAAASAADASAPSSTTTPPTAAPATTPSTPDEALDTSPSSTTSTTEEAHNWFAVVSEWVPGRMPGTPWTTEDFAAATERCELMAAALDPAPFDGLGSFIADLESGESSLLVPGQIIAGDRPLPTGLQPWVRRILPELADLVAAAPEVLVGGAVIHGDLRPDNLLIDDTGDCWTVDWNWLGLGPRWIDWVGLLPMAQHHGIDTAAAVKRSPLTADVPADELDCFAAVLAAYMLKNPDKPPPPGCTPALREHQRYAAWTFLGWLATRRGWTT